MVVPVPGYKSLLDRLAESRNPLYCSEGMYYRMYFQPSNVTLIRSPDGNSMIFDKVSMKLYYETKRGTTVVDDPISVEFTNHVTNNFLSYAKAFPIFYQVGENCSLFGKNFLFLVFFLQAYFFCSCCD